MVIFAALVLTVLSFIIIAVPLYRNRDNRAGAWAYEFEDLTTLSGKSRTMAKQLENDYRTGILSEQDYLSQQGMFQNASKPSETISDNSISVDDEIERKVAGLRSGGKPDISEEIEAKIRNLRQPQPVSGIRADTGAARQKKARFCPQCGAKVQPGARFCAQCGEGL